MCPFLPDSPRLLIRKGKHDQALEVLAALQGNGATTSSHSVQAQYSIIRDVLDREYAQKYTWWQLITGKGPAGVVRRMILGAWMQISNQISGINVTSYYMTVSSLAADIGCANGSLVRLYPCPGADRTYSPHSGGGGVCGLPYIFIPRLFRDRAIRTSKRHDDLCDRLLDLLGCDRDQRGTIRNW